ncbi:MAG: hypothetical protein IK115_02355 [Lachnospiraceae bacterium]|nr:hypothetical protein [Lachnospiraceae bacterium]
MLAFWFVLGIVAACFLIGLAFETPGFAKQVFLGCSLYQTLYLFLSGAFILFGCFTISLTAAVTALIFVALSLLVFFLNDCNLPEVRFLWKGYIPLILILLVAGIFACRQAAGVFGTGQDQGLYQTRAFFYMADIYDEEIAFPEYADCQNKWEKVSFEREIRDLTGYYIDQDRFEEKDEISGTLHGIGTFPALMALWGKLFGLRHMSWAMISCYLLSIGNVWLICRNLWSKKKLYAHLTALFFAATPIVLWCAQNSLTEIALTLGITTWFALLSDKRDGAVQLLGIIPAAGMCAVHIMCSVFIPLIVIVYVHGFIASGKRSMLVSMMGSVLCYGLSFTMMKLKYARYTDGNYKRIYWMTNNLLNEENMLAFVWIMVGLCLLVGIIFLIRGKKLSLRRLMYRKQEEEESGKAGLILSIICLVFSCGGLLLQIIRRLSEPEHIMHITLLGFLIMTGFVVVPAAFAATVTEGKKFLKDRRSFAFAFGMYYSVWIFAFMVISEVWQYYYYARYMAPFVFLFFILAGQLLSRVKTPVLCAAAVPLLALVILPNRALYLSQDLTNTQYDILEDLVSCIGENDVVLINEQGYHCQRLYTFPIKAMTGADIHFVWEEDVRSQAEEYDKQYDTVYLLSMYVGKLMADPVGWKEIYRTDVHGSIYEDLDDHLLPYPRKWTDMDTELVLLVNDPEGGSSGQKADAEVSK